MYITLLDRITEKALACYILVSRFYSFFGTRANPRFY